MIRNPFSLKNDSKTKTKKIAKRPFEKHVYKLELAKYKPRIENPSKKTNNLLNCRNINR